MVYLGEEPVHCSPVGVKEVKEIAGRPRKMNHRKFNPKLKLRRAMMGLMQYVFNETVFFREKMIQFKVGKGPPVETRPSTPFITWNPC